MIVVDEKSIMSMSASYGLTGGLLYNLQSELRLCGAPVDTLRLQDLYETDLSQCKMIVFANTFRIDEKMRKILKESAKDKTYVWNYATGILNLEFSKEYVKELTGFEIREFEHDYQTEELGYKIKQYKFGSIPELILDFPLIEILSGTENSEILKTYPNGKTLCAKVKKDGGIFCL